MSPLPVECSGIIGRPVNIDPENYLGEEETTQEDNEASSNAAAIQLRVRTNLKLTPVDVFDPEKRDARWGAVEAWQVQCHRNLAVSWNRQATLVGRVMELCVSTAKHHGGLPAHFLKWMDMARCRVLSDIAKMCERKQRVPVERNH